MKAAALLALFALLSVASAATFTITATWSDAACTQLIHAVADDSKGAVCARSA